MQELKQRLASPPAELTPAERKVVRALLDDYPRLGLGPMTRLARHAGVSDPTIMRLVKKLGFAGYGDFQEALLADVDDRLRSPRTLLAERRERMGRDDTWARYLDQAGQSLQQTLGLTRPDDIQRLADWLLDSRLRVHCHGGRFSRFLAGYLVTHLRLLRPQCRLLDDGALLPDQLYDLGRQDLLVLFDYRRYQSQAQHVAQAAKARGTRLVLFTDIYASPLREHADLIVSSPVESASPFDSLVPAMAQVEALVATLVARMGAPLDERLRASTSSATRSAVIFWRNDPMFSLPHHSPRDLPSGRRQTAILFVDMQRAWVEPGRDPHVDPQAAGYFYERVQNQVIPNQQRLLGAMRAVDENVLHTIIESLTADGRDRSLDHKLSEMHLPKGSPDARVIDALEPTANEIVLPKTSSGVFNSTAIDYVLRNLGTRHLIVCGVVTDQCVDMAVRDAADRGYLVTLVEDACATHTPERHQACLEAIKGYCWISDTETVLQRIAALGRSNL